MARIWAVVFLCTAAFVSCVSAEHLGRTTHRSHPHSYWLNAINHNGASPYNNDSSFVVYRNVMEYVTVPFILCPDTVPMLT